MRYRIKYDDAESLIKAIKTYIAFYNTGKLQEKLKGLTPSQFGNSINPNLLPLVI